MSSPVMNRTFRVVSLNSLPHKHLIEVPGDWKAKEVRKSERPLLCPLAVRYLVAKVDGHA